VRSFRKMRWQIMRAKLRHMDVRCSVHTMAPQINLMNIDRVVVLDVLKSLIVLIALRITQTLIVQ